MAWVGRGDRPDAADATDADLDQLVDTLATIWERATLPATGWPTSPGPQQGT